MQAIKNEIMKNISILFLFLFSFTNIQAQQKALKKVFLTEREGYYLQRILSIDKNNNKFVMGGSPKNMHFNNFSITTNKEYSYYLTMLDKNDSAKWLIKIADCNSNSFTTVSSITQYSIVSNSVATFIAINFMDTITVNGNDYISKGESDILFLKVNEIGQIQVLHHIGSVNNEGFNNRAITTDSKNNIYFVGGFGTQNLNTELIINSDTLKASKLNGFFIKMDSTGNILYSKGVGGNSYCGYNYIHCYHDEFYVIGSIRSSTIYLDTLTFSLPSNSDYTDVYFVAKLDTMGNAIWARHFGTKTLLGGIVANDVYAINDNVYITGGGINAIGDKTNRFYFQGKIAPVSGVPFGNGDYVIASYSSKGNFRWAKASVGYGDEFVFNLGADTNGNLLAIGEFNDLVNDSIPLNGFGDDVFVSSLDSNGNYLWSTSVGGVYEDFGKGIATTTDGEIYVMGATASPVCYFGQDSVHVDSLPSMFLAKIVNATPVSLQNPPKEDLWEVFPNPASTMLEIRCPMVGKKEIQLYNAVGQLVINLKTEYQTSNIETSKLPEGIYFLQLKQQGNTSTKKINIIH
jgi:hypothetical protein